MCVYYLFSSCSLGQACSHVAALLFYIEHKVTTGEDVLPTELSKTSKAMTWNQPPKKEIAPACANDIKFVKPSHSDLKELDDASFRHRRCDFDPRLAQHRSVQKDSIIKLVSGIKESVPKTGIQQFWEFNRLSASVLSSSSESSSLWSHVIFNHENTAMIQRTFLNPSVQQCFEHANSMAHSQSEVNSIKIATRGQASNKLWLALHNGRITSSRFGEILHRRESTNPQNLVKRIMGYGKHQTEHLPPQLRWGRDNESVACKCYLKDREKNNEIMLFEPTGLFLLPEKSYLGASADGKLTCTSVDTCCIGCLEIKCPYSIDGTLTISLTPDEIADKYGKKFFMQRGEDGLLHLPQKHVYYAQVQGEMAILNVEWCDFVVFSNGVVVVDRIIADYTYWTELCETLDNFYVQHVVPEIFCLKKNILLSKEVTIMSICY